MFKQADITFAVSSQAATIGKSQVQFSTQDRNTAKLIFKFFEGRAPLNLVDVTPELTMIMDDGSKFVVTPEVTENFNGVMEYTLKPNEIRHYGRVSAELTLKYPNDKTIGGFEFGFTIKQAMVDRNNAPLKEYYVQDLETIKKEVQTKAESIHTDIDTFKAGVDKKTSDIDKNLTTFKTDIDQRTAAVETKVNGFEADVAQTTVVQVENAKTDLSGTKQVDLDARLKADFGKVTTQLADTTSKIEELPHMPRLNISQIVHREGVKNAAGLNSDLVVFKDIYHVYDVPFKTTGLVYALEDHKINGTKQSVYKSLDGGNSWIKVGDLPMNQSQGVWFENIFVEPFQETFYLLRHNNGYNIPANNDVVSYTMWAGSTEFSQIGVRNIANRTWLSSHHSIDASPNKDYTERVVMFAEYGADINITELNIWRTADRGATWTSVLKQRGNNGVMYSGEIRHFHCIQIDPHTGDWWAGSGDGDTQCKIWRSQDDGLTWTVLFQGSQRERTCSFVFEKDYIYYGMDSTNKTHPEDIKIIRIKRSDLSRTDVGSIDMGYAVYNLTRTYYPDGFLVWSCYENNASIRSNRIAVQFYDYLTDKLYTIAYLNTKGLPDEYTGFQGASRYQDRQSGNVFAMPTINMQQGKFGYDVVSRYFKALVTT